MTEPEIIDMLKRRNNKENRRDVFEDYKHKITIKGFEFIWNNKTWKKYTTLIN